MAERQTSLEEARVHHEAAAEKYAARIRISLRQLMTRARMTGALKGIGPNGGIGKIPTSVDDIVLAGEKVVGCRPGTALYTERYVILRADGGLYHFGQAFEDFEATWYPLGWYLGDQLTAHEYAQEGPIFIKRLETLIEVQSSPRVHGAANSTV